MKEPSASQLDLAMRCGHPWTSGHRWPWEEKGDAAIFGDRVHLVCEALFTGDACFPAAYFGLTPAEIKKLEGCVEQARSHLEWTGFFEGGLPEVELRYDVESGKVRRAERGDPKRPGEWTARIDLVVPRGSTLVVLDWKTGRKENARSAADAMQIKLCALAAARFFGARNVLASLVYLDDYKHRASEDAAEFGPFDLACIATELRDLRRSLTAGPTPPKPGMHCTDNYCRLRGICSATSAALASVYPLERRLTPEIKDVDHARWTLEHLKGAEAALEAVKQGVQEFARSQPVPMGEGKVYGWREQERRTIAFDSDEQVTALRELLGQFADQAIEVKRSATIKSIADAAAAALNGAKGKGKLVDEALERLEQVGALTRSKYEKAEIFKVEAS